MSPQARINSIPVLRQLRASLINFASIASVAVEEANSEIQRTLLWLREDQYRYWKEQVQTRTEQYTRARLALKQREVLDRALAGTRSSCVDEKKAVQVAERRLREAEQKLRMVRTWSRQIEKELLDYKGAIRGLVAAIETEIPNACARLDKMTDSLEAYIAVAPPEMAWSAGEKPESTVLRAAGVGDQSSALFLMQERVGALRGAAPPPETRQAVPTAAVDSEWIARIRFSEALVTAAQENATRPTEVRSADRIVLAQPQGEPALIFLARTFGGDGDTGWYVGADEDTEPADYVAVPAADLLRARPEMTAILNLPPGYLVQINLSEGLEAVFDPDDNMVWWNLEQEKGTPTE